MYRIFATREKEEGRRKKEEEEKQCYKTYPAKRWVVERTNLWHNMFRKLFTRYEKKLDNYLGVVQFSCCIIIYRKIILG